MEIEDWGEELLRELDDSIELVSRADVDVGMGDGVSLVLNKDVPITIPVEPTSGGRSEDVTLAGAGDSVKSNLDDELGVSLFFIDSNCFSTLTHFAIPSDDCTTLSAIRATIISRAQYRMRSHLDTVPSEDFPAIAIGASGSSSVEEPRFMVTKSS
jgi:hypothetical protein